MGGHPAGGSAFHRHPCFCADAGTRFGRIHLPVAPACNIQCSYCGRKHDCVNESRPGVTSELLEPAQAVDRLKSAMSRMPCLSVAGIAGPGDPFCTPDATLLTLESCRRAFPDILLCVSSNGYNVAPYLKDLKTLGVGFITITVNAVNPDIGSRIYRWVGQEPALHGREGAAMLLDRQMEALEGLRAGGFSVKVNTVVIPGVNDEHVIDIARKVSVFKVDRMNLIGVIPVAGTSLACTPPPSSSLMARLRRSAQAFVPQMHHCARCRSDAVGLLHDDKPQPGFDGKPRPNGSCAAGISR